MDFIYYEGKVREVKDVTLGMLVIVLFFAFLFVMSYVIDDDPAYSEHFADCRVCHVR